MKATITTSRFFTLLLLVTQSFYAQQQGLSRTVKSKIATTEVPASDINNANQKSINSINGGMPNRISMNVTVAKQTQGATFGEKVNAGKINVTLVEGGCVVVFSNNEGYRINTTNNTITPLAKQTQGATFGEKVNQGLHAAGSALSQGASLLGGALPGGSIISASVSSVGNLSGTGGGAAAASYAATGKMAKPKVVSIQDNQNDAAVALPDGEFELVFIVVEKATSGLKDTLKTQVRIGFTVENGILKTKHDTAKNSVSNIR